MVSDLKFGPLTEEDLAIMNMARTHDSRWTLLHMRAGDVEDAITIAHLRSIKRMLPARLNAIERAYLHGHYANQWRVAHGSYLAMSKFSKFDYEALPNLLRKQAE